MFHGEHELTLREKIPLLGEELRKRFDVKFQSVESLPRVESAAMLELQFAELRFDFLHAALLTSSHHGFKSYASPGAESNRVSADFLDDNFDQRPGAFFPEALIAFPFPGDLPRVVGENADGDERIDHGLK